jgi:hypothetical protein
MRTPEFAAENAIYPSRLAYRERMGGFVVAWRRRAAAIQHRLHVGMCGMQWCAGCARNTPAAASLRDLLHPVSTDPCMTEV